MLKKLAKYGNSNVLVLDRAILELLGIGEGSVVKLRTDGKSLIITPEDPVKTPEISMTGSEIITDAIESQAKKSLDAMMADPVKREQAVPWMPGGEHFSKGVEAFKPLFEKYKKDIALLGSEPFVKESEALAEKYRGNRTSPEFLKEFMPLRLKYAPNLVHFDKEMLEVCKVLGAPESA